MNSAILRALSGATGPLILTLALFAAAPYPGHALAPPTLKGHVNDLAGLLDDQTRTSLEKQLSAYEAETGHQFALLIVPGLEGDPLEDFSIRVVEQWKLGDKKRDDGLLMLVALKDRKVRIEVGYGLEGAIPDATAKRVIEDFITPSFRGGKYAEGIRMGFGALMKAAQRESLGQPPKITRRGEVPGWFVLIFPLFFLMIVSGALPRFLRLPMFGALGGFFGFSALGGILGLILGAIFGSILGLVPLRGLRGGVPMGGGFRGGGGFGGGGFGGGGGGFGGGGASGGW
ncbi:MAG: TPM domain-containing protein [Myxococcales bacterium]|nr:TPM domain-containing protein [Myxococcales bacterium]MCB9709004.1 TPM domain-containing protein [Myxococcales bacterium]